MSVNRRAAQLLSGTCDAVIGAMARYLPAGPYRDFASWAYSAQNPRRLEFLQAGGLIQVATMNVTLLGGLVEGDAWAETERYAVIMNAYQAFETISDNLGMGLGAPRLDEPARERLGLLASFNRSILRALEPGYTAPALLLLSGAPQQAAARASAFDQSLAGGTHAGVVEEYAKFVRQHGNADVNPTEIEFGLWGALVVNIEMARETVSALTGLATQQIYLDGLRNRYIAVDRCLRGPDLPRLELAGLGARTILVSPTLAYFAAILGEIISQPPAYRSIVADGSLGDLLTDAALLVRLQNDIGPRLLRLTAPQQSALLHRLTVRMHEARLVSAEEVLALLVAEAEADAAFTRLHKDLASEEFNLALWHPRRAEDAPSALRAFGESLGYFSTLYQQHSTRLATGIAMLDERLGDRRIGMVIDRFVRFHERLYSNRYTDRLGEYAI
jgi:hypothetical protein